MLLLLQNDTNLVHQLLLGESLVEGAGGSPRNCGTTNGLANKDSASHNDGGDFGVRGSFRRERNRVFHDFFHRFDCMCCVWHKRILMRRARRGQALQGATKLMDDVCGAALQQRRPQLIECHVLVHY